MVTRRNPAANLRNCSACGVRYKAAWAICVFKDAMATFSLPVLGFQGVVSGDQHVNRGNDKQGEQGTDGDAPH